MKPSCIQNCGSLRRDSDPGRSESPDTLQLGSGLISAFRVLAGAPVCLHPGHPLPTACREILEVPYSIQAPAAFSQESCINTHTPVPHRRLVGGSLGILNPPCFLHCHPRTFPEGQPHQLPAVPCPQLPHAPSKPLSPPCLPELLFVTGNLALNSTLHRRFLPPPSWTKQRVPSEGHTFPTSHSSGL